MEREIMKYEKIIEDQTRLDAAKYAILNPNTNNTSNNLNNSKANNSVDVNYKLKIYKKYLPIIKFFLFILNLLNKILK